MEPHDGIRVVGPPGERYDEVLTPEALTFLHHLHNTFEERRHDRLAALEERRARVAAGDDPEFLAETKHIREDADWRVAPPAPGLEDRRVEMTGPTTRSMTVNALNSGAKVWLADFEDATSPTWHNIVTGQLNLIDALDRRIDFTADSGKEYRLGEEIPIIVVRPRGWHLPENHILVNGSPNGKPCRLRALPLPLRQAPAGSWQWTVFLPTQAGKSPRGPADKVRGDKDREANDGFDGSWVAHPDLVPICRAVVDDVLGQHPNQLDRVRDDVEVSAADLLAVETVIGNVTEAGLRANVRVSLGYLDAWLVPLGGNGAVAIDHLMEDAATVEIARSQVWQWLHYGISLSDGRRVTRQLVDSLVEREFARWRRERPSTMHLDQAREIFTCVALEPDYPSFSTVDAYGRYLVTATG
jgi:malate synthase